MMDAESRCRSRSAEGVKWVGDNNASRRNVSLIIRVILTNTSRKMENEYVQRWSLYPRSLEHLARKSINQNTTI